MIDPVGTDMTKNAHPTSNQQRWEDHYSEILQSPSMFWPNEALVKTIFGSYLSKPFSLPEQATVLDVGCGMGGNLRPFMTRGHKCHGVEVTDKTAGAIQEALDAQGFNMKIHGGTNRALPFEDETFDLLISVNVVHYETNEENLKAAFQEYRRVLKPGGALYLSTVGPKHEIYQSAEVAGPHRYKIANYDFRNDEIYFYFDNEKYLKSYLKESFVDVETGNVTERLMSRTVDFLTAFARRDEI